MQEMDMMKMKLKSTHQALRLVSGPQPGLLILQTGGGSEDAGIGDSASK
jgi:hypothetical protein